MTRVCLFHIAARGVIGNEIAATGVRVAFQLAISHGTFSIDKINDSVRWCVGVLQTQANVEES